MALFPSFTFLKKLQNESRPCYWWCFCMEVFFLIWWRPVVKHDCCNLFLDYHSPMNLYSFEIKLISKYNALKYYLGFSSFLLSSLELSWASQSLPWAPVSGLLPENIQSEKPALFFLSSNFFSSFLSVTLPCGIAGEKGLWCGLTAT